MRYLVVLLLAACAKEGAWMKPGATDQDFHADRGECVSKAFVAPTANQQSMILAGCMQGKGWHWREK